MNVVAADFSQIPMSQHLAATLARASDMAGATGSADVSLEHVLMALCDDPDAEAVLMASRVDVARLKSETVGYLGSLPQQYSSGGLGVAPALSRILEAAAAAARGGRRRDINGAIVLAAIVGDGKSAAAQILQAHGLTFDEAIRALQAALAVPARDAVPDFRPADDVLARARERVQSRSAPGLRDIMNDQPRSALPPPAPPVPMLPPPVSEETAQAASRESAVEAAAQAPEPMHELEAERATAGDSVANSTPPPQPSWPPQRMEPAAPQQGYVYPSEQQVAPQYPSLNTQLGTPPVLFDLTRPVPIAAPPPIPPPIPQSSSSGPPRATEFGGLPGFSRGAEPSFAPPPMSQPPIPSQHGQYPGQYPSPYPGDLQSYPPFAPPHGQLGGQSAGGMAMPPAPPMPAPAMPPQQARVARPKVEIGQLAENIPRGMRVGKTERVEVRIAKAAAKAITEGLEGGGVAWRHEVTITQAMSVRLRAPDGGFFIETVSPETQWIENQLGFASDDFASWRFLVTPQSRGWTRLQIVVSARTIGADGMAAETALPDQVVDVKVRTNYKRSFVRWLGWIIAAVAGGALAKFGEGGFNIVQTVVQKLMN